MRLLLAALAVLALMAACADQAPTRIAVDPALGVRAADDGVPRTTAGAGTSGGNDNREVFEALPAAIDGTTGTTSDPTTGSTASSPQDESEAPGTPHHSGTTGSGLVPHAPDDGAEAMPV